MTKETKSIIVVNDLQKKYQNAPDFALKGVSLTINKGEFFGLLGPNSAGKTTLISIMCGLLKITSGTVTVGDIDVKQHPRKISNIIGLIPQELALYPNLTIKENIRYF